jgi:hypothetical protein
MFAANGSYGVSKDGGTRSFLGLTTHTRHLTGFNTTWAYYTAFRLPCESCTWLCKCSPSALGSVDLRLPVTLVLCQALRLTAQQARRTACDSRAGVQTRAKIIRLKHWPLLICVNQLYMHSVWLSEVSKSPKFRHTKKPSSGNPPSHKWVKSQPYTCKCNVVILSTDH